MSELGNELGMILGSREIFGDLMTTWYLHYIVHRIPLRVLFRWTTDQLGPDELLIVF